MQELVSADTRSSGRGVLLNMARFPALIALYAGGLASLHRGHFGSLRAVAMDPNHRAYNGTVPLISAVNPCDVFQDGENTTNVLAQEADGRRLGDVEIQNVLSGRSGRKYTPVSNYLHDHLRPHFSDLIVDDAEYTAAFDSLEVLLGVIATDVELTTSAPNRYVRGGWCGAFTWRDRHSHPSLEEQLQTRLASAGDEAPELRAGLFGGSSERALRAAEQFVADAAVARGQRT